MKVVFKQVNREEIFDAWFNVTTPPARTDTVIVGEEPWYVVSRTFTDEGHTALLHVTPKEKK